MIEAYKIGVALSLTSNHAQVLQALSSGLLGVHTKIKDLEKGWSRVHLAMAGTAAVLAGGAIIAGIKNITEAAKGLSHELVQIQKLGISQSDFDRVRRESQRVTRVVPGTTQESNLKGFGQAYSMFGAENALKLMEPLQRYAQVLGNTSGNYEQAETQLYSMLRAADLMGKFVNAATHQVDISQVQRFLNLGAQINLATEGRVGPQAMLGLAQQGGPALSNMSDMGLMTMGIASQAMGGMRAGTALTSLYQQMVGGKMTQYAAQGLNELGLVGGYKVGKGGHILWDKGSLDNNFTSQLKSDPLVAVETMKKAMEGHGLDTIEKQVPKLFEILGRQTTQRLVHDLLRNLPQIMQERGRISGVMGVDAAADLQNRKDLTQALHNVDQAWRDFLATIGQSDAMISFLNKLADTIKSMTTAVQAWPPGRLEAIGTSIAILGAALIGAGGIAILAAIGPAGWLVLGIGALGAVVTYFYPQIVAAWELLKKIFEEIAQVFTTLAGKLTGALKGISDFLGGKEGGIGKSPGTPPGMDTGTPFVPISYRTTSYTDSPASSAAGASSASSLPGWHGGRVGGQSFVPNAAVSGGIGTHVGQMAYLNHLAASGGADVSHLDPEFAGRIAAFQAGLAKEGINTKIISGYRSTALQAQLYARHLAGGPLAAAPGHSFHNYGLAVDMLPIGGDQTAALARMAREAPKYGIYPGANFGDRDHFQSSRRLRDNWRGQPQDSREREHQTHIYLDGKKIAQVVTKHQTKGAWAPRQAAYHDRKGFPTAPDVGYATG